MFSECGLLAPESLAHVGGYRDKSDVGVRAERGKGAGEVGEGGLPERLRAGRWRQWSSRTKLALEIWAIGDELEEEWRTSSGWQFSGN